MKEIVVLSGKGGTGKTAVVASFAALSDNQVLCDCDVDAANLHLVLQPTVRERHEFWGQKVAIIDGEVCTCCGLCLDACRFEAIQDFQVDPLSCEGCGFCLHVCPEQAVTMVDRLAGHWYVSDTRYGPLVHARLGAGQENSGKLVTAVRQKARIIAEEGGSAYILSDGPPGIGCPVIASLSGASLALVVTEPSLSAIHDLERVLAVCRHFGTRTLVCINKYDLDEENSQHIEDYCRRVGVEVGARIPFDTVVSDAIARRVPVVEFSDGVVSQRLEELWRAVDARW
ncbi:MAG: ATP-binding protein [Dehalococcoidia bacterium]